MFSVCILCASCFFKRLFLFFPFLSYIFLRQSFRCARGVKRVGISASSSQRPGSQPQQRETSLATSMSCLMFLRSITLGSHRFAKIPMIFQIRNSVNVLLCVTLPIRTIITNLVWVVLWMFHDMSAWSLRLSLKTNIVSRLRGCCALPLCTRSTWTKFAWR